MRTVPRRSSIALLAAVAAVFAAPSVAVAAEGDIIVKYAAGADAQERADARADADVVARGALPVAQAEVVAPERGTTVGEAVADLERSPDVAYAEADAPRSAFDLLPDEARVDGHGNPLNDKPFGNLWALRNTGQAIRGITGAVGADIGAPAAWGVTTGNASVKVAVVDSGVDRTHPDLFANLTTGYDYAYDDADPTDYAGHGTHVAGIIAARGNNGTGVTGVAWQTSLIPVQALDAAGEGSTSDIVSAYTYAVGRGARIVNASFGGSDYSQLEYNAIRAASNVLFVVAAGNDTANDDTTPSYPCAYNLPNILCVAATDNSDRLASFSNYGRTSVDIAAPGEQIYSTYRCDSYGWLSGTSMAAPEVSGAAALVLAKSPTLSATALRTKLISTADPLSPADAPKIAGGRLDVAKAVGASITTTTPPDSTTHADGSGTTAPATVFAEPRVGEPAPPAPKCPAAPVRSGTGTVDPNPVTPYNPPPTPTNPSVPPTPGPTVDTPRTTPAPVVDRTAPSVAAALGGRGALKLLLASKLRVTTTAGERASLRVELRLDGRTAKKLHLTTRSSAVTVATGTASIAKAGTAKVRVRLTPEAKRALKAVGRLKVSVRATATDAAGNARTRGRTVTITR
jgi:subtilisin family serine protease